MVTKSLLQQIGKQIAIARSRRNMTQYSLNHWAGLPEARRATENHIAKLERGELNVSIETLEKIAKTLGCKIEIKIRMDRKVTPPKVLNEVQENIPAEIIQLREKLKRALPAS